MSMKKVERNRLSGGGKVGKLIAVAGAKTLSPVTLEVRTQALIYS